MNTRLLRHFSIYCLVGACAFAADYSVFLLFIRADVTPYAANVAGICCGIAVSFTLNRAYNFRKLDVAKERAVKFVGVALMGMGLSTLFLWAFLNSGIDVRVAKALAMAFVFVVQFLANALWTFR